MSSLASKTYGGGTPKTSIAKYWQGNFPWIQSSDLKQDEINNVTPQKFISQEAINNSATKVVPENSIAIVTRVGVGKLAFIPYSYGTSQDFLSLSDLNLESQFGVYSLYIMLKKELNNIQGTSIKGITKKDLLRKVINAPIDLNEQQKIGAFFKQLDNTIALHQRKLELLQKMKQGFLQKMFPLKEEKVPEVRFANFSSNWEQRKLGKVGDLYNNLRIPVTASDRIKGDIPYYGANGVQDYVNGFTHEGEFVLIAEDGANDLINYPVNYVKGKIWVNNHAHVVSGKFKLLDTLFLASRIKSMNISPWLVGGGRAKLNGNVLKNILILLPGYEEQNKLGAFFNQLDTTIALHQNKLEELKKIKKAFLQKLFI